MSIVMCFTVISNMNKYGTVIYKSLKWLLNMNHKSTYKIFTSCNYSVLKIVPISTYNGKLSPIILVFVWKKLKLKLLVL